LQTREHPGELEIQDRQVYLEIPVFKVFKGPLGLREYVALQELKASEL
jgi:hypothetical protein